MQCFHVNGKKPIFILWNDKKYSKLDNNSEIQYFVNYIHFSNITEAPSTAASICWAGSTSRPSTCTLWHVSSSSPSFKSRNWSLASWKSFKWIEKRSQLEWKVLHVQISVNVMIKKFPHIANWKANYLIKEGTF